MGEKLEPKTDEASELDRFQDALRKVLSVPKDEVLREEARLKAEREREPRKAGRQKKVA